MEPGLDLFRLRRRRERALTVLALLLILAAAGGAAYYVLQPRPVTDPSITVAAQDAVREDMGPGLQLRFRDSADGRVQSLARNRYQVSGRFETVSAAGRSRDYSFVCVVERLPDGRWGPAQLSISPR